MLLRCVMCRTVASTGPRSAGSLAPHFIGSGFAPNEPLCVVRLMICVGSQVSAFGVIMKGRMLGRRARRVHGKNAEKLSKIETNRLVSNNTVRKDKHFE